MAAALPVGLHFVPPRVPYSLDSRLDVFARPTNEEGALRSLGAGSRSGGEPLAHRRSQLTASKKNKGLEAPGGARRRILACALRDGTKHDVRAVIKLNINMAVVYICIYI
jgi:hypothetical protein